MRYIYILIIIFSIGVSSDNCNKIDLSENKRNLSNEIFNKLEKEHYLKKIDKNNFNKNILMRLSKGLMKIKTYLLLMRYKNLSKNLKFLLKMILILS